MLVERGVKSRQITRGGHQSVSGVQAMDRIVATRRAAAAIHAVRHRDATEDAGVTLELGRIEELSSRIGRRAKILSGYGTGHAQPLEHRVGEILAERLRAAGLRHGGERGEAGGVVVELAPGALDE